MRGLLLFLVLGSVDVVGAVPPAPAYVVDLGFKDTSLSLQTKMAVQVCVGLYNRAGPVAYSLFSGEDLHWLQDLTEGPMPEAMNAADLLTMCLGDGGPATGFLLYNYTQQQIIVPNLLTLAAVLDAVPLEAGAAAIGTSRMVFDATTAMHGFDARTATEYVYEHHVNQTTTMAKMNPGLDVNGGHPFNPPLTNELDPRLIDFIVKQRLFNFFLNLGCVPGTKEHALMERMVHNNPWPSPIKVYGYDNTIPIAGGDVFEAETTCVSEHNMGQVATSGVSNLAFLSTSPAIDHPLLQNAGPSPPEAYNASRTYIAFIVGDGDNVAYLKGARRKWMRDRVNRCAKDPSYQGCFPLVWTISPAILTIAPGMLRWYFNQSYLTGNDFFCLPPSGDLYAYPGMMRDQDQVTFVERTERDAVLLNTSGTVEWEFFYSWRRTMKTYAPRYATNSIIQALFAVNVPYMLPTGIFGPHEFFKTIDGRTSLFRPREWRGSGPHKNPIDKKEFPSPAKMAQEVNGYPAGTVTAIYLTSDGGGSLDNFYDLVPLLDEHVQVVNQDVVARMALQSAKLKSA